MGLACQNFNLPVNVIISSHSHHGHCNHPTKWWCDGPKNTSSHWGEAETQWCLFDPMVHRDVPHLQHDSIVGCILASLLLKSLISCSCPWDGSLYFISLGQGRSELAPWFTQGYGISMCIPWDHIPGNIPYSVGPIPLYLCVTPPLNMTWHPSPELLISYCCP